MTLSILIDDILDIELSENEYIAQQCNATHNRCFGLSSALFKKYPKANIYNGKNKVENRTVGDIIVKEKIINIIGQKHQGKQSHDDTNNMRLKWFNSALSKIEKIPNIKRVYMPYRIGCGLAGGNWDAYLKCLVEWSNKSNICIVVIKKE